MSIPQAIAQFFCKLSFMQAQLLIAELGIFILAIIFMVAKFAKISGIKEIDKKEGTVTFNTAPKPKRKLFHRKPKAVKL